MEDLDFTDAVYERLLETARTAGYDFLTVGDYFQRRATLDRGLPERFLIIRHDVDRKLRNALAMARIESEYDVSGSYYVRTIEKTFQPESFERLAALGHEVGYQYEDVDRAGGDLQTAVRSFQKELRTLRDHVTVDTVAGYENPLTAHDNRSLWDRDAPGTFDLLGDAYRSMDFSEVVLFADTDRTWRDSTLEPGAHADGEGRKDVQARSTFDLIDLLAARRVNRVCLLVHPNRWASSVPELVFEHAVDTAVNVVKRGFEVVT